MQEPDVSQKIKKAVVRLVAEHPFFGYLAINLKLVADSNNPTTSTDGEHLFYNPEFVESLSPKHLEFVIAHEVLHCAMGHLARRKDREALMWNVAADHAINQILQKEGMEAPEIALRPDYRYDGMSAEEIYSKLEREAYAPYHPSPHCMKPGDGQAKGDDEMSELWKQRTERASVFDKQFGRLPGLSGVLKKSGEYSRLDWKTILADLLHTIAKNDFRLMPPSKKHLWRPIYLPSIGGNVLEIAIGIDTSGSISDKDFSLFMGEIRGITEQFSEYTLHLFFCDTIVHSRMTLTHGDVWPESFPNHGGGTDFTPVFEMIESEQLQVSALVYLTDCEGTFPLVEPPYQTIWISKQERVVPWGTRIVMGV